MASRETPLPGVGTKYTIDIDQDEELVAVEHRAGQWELARVDAEGNSTALLVLPSRQAAELGRVLSHAEVPQEESRKRLLLEEFAIEWVELSEGSPLVDQTLRDSDIRARSGASVMAVLRSEGSILSPPPETIFRAGDTLVVIGNREQVDRFLETFAALPE